MKHRYCYQMARSSEFGVWNSEFTRYFTEVKWDGVFLDIGFSSCTVPTFCHSLVILDVGLEFGSDIWSYEE